MADTVKLNKSGKLSGAPTCPNCKSIINGFTGVNDAQKPSEGDISVCAYCYHLLKFIQHDGYPHLSVCYLTAKEFESVNDFPFPARVKNGRVIVDVKRDH